MSVQPAAQTFYIWLQLHKRLMSLANNRTKLTSRLLEVDLAAALLHLAPYLQQHYPAASKALPAHSHAAEAPANQAPANQQVQALESPAHPCITIWQTCCIWVLTLKMYSNEAM